MLLPSVCFYPRPPNFDRFFYRKYLAKFTSTFTYRRFVKRVTSKKLSILKYLQKLIFYLFFINLLFYLTNILFLFSIKTILLYLLISNYLTKGMLQCKNCIDSLFSSILLNILKTQSLFYPNDKRKEILFYY